MPAHVLTLRALLHRTAGTGGFPLGIVSAGAGAPIAPRACHPRDLHRPGPEGRPHPAKRGPGGPAAGGARPRPACRRRGAGRAAPEQQPAERDADAGAETLRPTRSHDPSSPFWDDVKLIPRSILVLPTP